MSQIGSNWATAKLGDICAFKYGKALPADARNGGEISVYGSNGVVGHHDQALSEGPTIVIGRKGSFGEINYSDGPCWPIDTAYFIDRSATRQDVRWLSYRLAAMGLNGMNKSAAVPGLNREDAYRLKLKLPPLPEQRRIAAILDQADALRAKRREALAQLDSLTQSIFIEMFGDPIQNTKRWKVGNLESVASFFAGNSLPAGVPYGRQEGGHFLMKVSDMNLPENEQFIHRCQAWTDEGGARSATCPAGSVVVPKRGGAIGTNKKRITTRPTILDPNLMAIAPRDSALNLSYLFQWFMHFDLASISSGSSVPQLNKQDLAPLKIQIPPLALQQTFAARIQAVESLKTTNRAALTELDALFASLQHRAFAGQLS